MDNKPVARKDAVASGTVDNRFLSDGTSYPKQKVRANSLSMVSKGNQIGIVNLPELDVAGIMLTSGVKNSINSFPALIMNLPHLVTIHGKFPFASFNTDTGTTVRAYAAMTMGFAAELVVPLIDHELKRRDAQEIVEAVKGVDGFVTDGESIIEAMRRHTQDLHDSIERGDFRDDPDQFAQALSELSKSYLGGHGELFPRFTTGIENALTGGKGNPVVYDQAKTAKADVLLEEAKKVFGVEALNGRKLTQEQERAISLLRGAIETPLMQQRNNLQARNYLTDIYADEIEQICPGAKKDISDRLQALEECDKLFYSNVPKSRLQKGIERIADKLGIELPTRDTPVRSASISSQGRGL